MLSAEDNQNVVELESRLNLPQGFCASLLHENDWSFVIKFHAVFEAALTRLLAHQLGHDELLDVFARLDMSHTGYGKLAFAKSLGCLEDEERRFIRKWSELRNVLVHDVTNVSFDLDAHLALLDAKRCQSFLNGLHLEGCFQPDIRLTDHRDAVRNNPKEFLFLGALSLLWNLSHYFAWADHDREVEHLRWLENKFDQNKDDEEEES